MKWFGLNNGFRISGIKRITLTEIPSRLIGLLQPRIYIDIDNFHMHSSQPTSLTQVQEKVQRKKTSIDIDIRVAHYGR